MAALPAQGPVILIAHHGPPHAALTHPWYIFKPPILVRPTTAGYNRKGEPLKRRTYTSLVKWKSKGGSPGRISIERVRYEKASHKGGRDRIFIGQRDVSAQVAIAIYGQQILDQGTPVPLAPRLYKEFGDLAHLFLFANVKNPDRPSGPPLQFGLPDLYRDRKKVERLLTGPHGQAVRIPMGNVDREDLEKSLQAVGYLPKTAGPLAQVPQLARLPKFSWSEISE